MPNIKPYKLFIAGTDTNVGKTYIGTGLLSGFNQAGFTTVACKPIASGCEQYNSQWRNADALALQQASSIQLDYDDINPFAFAEPIAPHIAAQRRGCHLTAELLKQKCATALNYDADICLIEGAGGWHTPLNSQETFADFVVHMQLNVILVVGMRLGCLNHSILTYNAMQQAGAKISGWIANCIEPDLPALEENLDSLRVWLPAPCLGIVRYHSRVSDCVTRELIFLHDRRIAG